MFYSSGNGKTAGSGNGKKRVFFMRKVSKKMLLAVFLATFLVFALFGLSQASSRIFSSVSIITRVVPSKNLRGDDGRTNVLLLGIDKRAPGEVQSGILTDTIMLISFSDRGENISVISLPRDLWVNYGNNNSAKINEVYAYAGIQELERTVSNVLGVPIHYYVAVGFSGFREAVDSLGGINVEVANTFDDYRYPIPGKENDTCGMDLNELRIKKANDEGIDYENEEELLDKVSFTESDFPCRFEHIHFEKGTVSMDGDTALKYARSRHSADFYEGSDFARARRQQQVILAIKDKIFSVGTLLNPARLSEIYGSYKKYVDTDINIGDARAFLELATKFDFSKDVIRTAVLANGSNKEPPGSGLLYSPADKTLYGGRYVLIPVAGDFSKIRAFAQNFIFGE